MRLQGRIPTGRTIRATASSPQRRWRTGFLHIKAFARRQPRPVGEEIVTYELQQDKQGRLRASAVQFVARHRRQRVVANMGPGRWPGLASFSLHFGRSHRRRQDASAVAGFYAAISITAFIAYALDKSAARDGRWRIAENTLHLLALLGGWPVRCWRNTACAKSSKPAFLIIPWATVLPNAERSGCC
jgi:uncharacterized membrane protein YsdA (DUF1294 family)